MDVKNMCNSLKLNVISEVLDPEAGNHKKSILWSGPEGRLVCLK